MAKDNKNMLPSAPGQDKNGRKPRFSLNWLYFILIGALAYVLFYGQRTEMSSFNKEVS